MVMFHALRNKVIAYSVFRWATAATSAAVIGSRNRSMTNAAISSGRETGPVPEGFTRAARSVRRMKAWISKRATSASRPAKSDSQRRQRPAASTSVGTVARAGRPSRSDRRSAAGRPQVSTVDSGTCAQQTSAGVPAGASSRCGRLAQKTAAWPCSTRTRRSPIRYSMAPLVTTFNSMSS